MARNTEKRVKWETNTVWSGVWRETLKNMKNEMHIVEPGIWQETLKKVQNETQTQFDLEYGEKNSKMWKMWNA